MTVIELKAAEATASLPRYLDEITAQLKRIADALESMNKTDKEKKDDSEKDRA